MRFIRVLRERRQLSAPGAEFDGFPPLPQNASLLVPLRYHPNKIPSSRKIAVFIHAYYAADFADTIERHLYNLPVPADVYFTTDTVDKEAFLNQRFQFHDKIKRLMIRVTANRGRDIYPKLGAMNKEHLEYDYVLHLHTKKSDHLPELRDWCAFLWQHLLGSPDIVRSIIEIFECCPDVGMIAPQHFPSIRPWIHWAGCKDLATPFATRIGVDLEKVSSIDFPSGSMFWARPRALMPILGLNLLPSDFPEEQGQLSLTNAHAIERLFFLSSEAAGLKWLKIALPAWHPTSTYVQQISSRSNLRRFVEGWNVALLHQDSEVGN